ncbi:MAG: hypothetical protein LCH96_06455 [Actinobacteria bacterium]|nr:hypothetical protein [Actinomycetota bacterium]
MADEHPHSDEGQPIYDFLLARLDATGRLADSGVELPDVARMAGADSLRWVAGGLDGALGHHAAGAPDLPTALRVADLIIAAADDPSPELLDQIARTVAAERALEYVDAMIARLAQLEADPVRVHALARRLATTAPDRGVVKIGLALLGVTGLGDDLAVVRTLGAHEEFTLFAAVAIENGVPESDRELWALAQVVDGWGRIHCVEALRDTTDPEIRAWILRTGFRNSVMYEYLAHIAATTGGLLPALRGDDVDRELLTAAGEILSALVAGGPAEDLDDYDDAAEAVDAFLVLMTVRAETLDDFHAVGALEQFLAQPEGWDDRADRGWTPERHQRLLAACVEVLARPAWDATIADGLAADDRTTFWKANEAARKRGIDTFDVVFGKVAADPFGTLWFAAWAQADAARAQRLVDLVHVAIPLEQIATGGADEPGGGDQFRPHRALDWTLQALRAFPGIGGDLLLVGLWSPMTRNRNMALNALAAWPATDWPLPARTVVTELATTDPDERTRKLAADALGS